MTTSTAQRLARCTLWMGALFTATALFAGPAEDYAQADAALNAGDLPTGMSLMRKAADANHPRAQARLGDLLRSAEFEAQAVEMYRKAAAQGDAAGDYGLGRAYADGAGVKKDDKLALEWYQKAEQKNYAPAADALARAYRGGSLGVPRDAEKAAAYEKRFLDLQAARGPAR